MPTTAYIALGSNLGDRRGYLDRAVAALRATPGIVVRSISSYHGTEPVGPPGQGPYLNAAAELQTTLSAAELLVQLLRIESELERVRTEQNGPRTLDLDLLLFGFEVHHIVRPDLHLTVPHPRMHGRPFVLEPLAEIAPFAVHPTLGSTVRDLLKRLNGTEVYANLRGMKALVTGSTSGIGKAIAFELARGGADVIIHGRSMERMGGVCDEIRSLGVNAGGLLCPLDNPGEYRTWWTDQAWNVWDGLDIWVNNAGVDILTGDARHWPFEKKLQALWAVDVEATIALSRDIGARMKKKGSGVILNIGWDQAETGMDGDSGQLFGATKGAVMAFTRSLAVSLAPQVRVNCIAPGWIRTAWGEGASTPWQERVLRETPVGRWGTPEDIAQTARWLCSPAASYIMGQIIRVNGGAIR